MKKRLALIGPVVLLATFGLTACGSTTSTATTKVATPKTTQTSKVAAQPQAEQTMTIIPGLKKGSDGKMHDSYSPSDLTVVKGVPTKVTVYNYDDGSHDFVAKDLNLNVKVPGSKKKGDPSVTTFTVTADKTGDFHWLCDVTCDGAGDTSANSAKGWAMANDGYMAGKIHVLDQQPAKDNFSMTIKDGLKLGTDGKIHDSFSPADINVQKGVPMEVTVYNYDTGAHDLVSQDLNLNVQFPGAKENGVPSVTTFTINADKAGDFHWLCNVPCDGAGDQSKPDSAKGWAMANDGYMAGMIHIK